MKKIFLETSIQIHRLLYEDWRKAQIEGNLVGNETITSQYVIMEFRRNPLQAINYLSAMPTANISAPADGDEVGGTFNVIGSVDDIDTDYSDFSWTLEYARGSNATSGFQTIREGKSPVQNSILA
ncbi:TPA: hypothetical protein EYP66_23075, partial [Candidatus Poribacteria bacterium]|nr:hypothetical protein [Candidatus Poribacteria bacterium]